MSDDAQLRDITVEPNPLSAASTKEPASAEPAAVAPPSAQITDSEAAEIGRLMLESGYTRERINEVLQAPQALQSLRYMIDNNPQEFLQNLERVSPNTGEKFLEKMADVYVERYGDRSARQSKGNDKAPNSELMSEVESLRNEVAQFRTQKEQDSARAAMAQVQSRYNARVDDLFGQIPKEVEFTKSERTALRALLDKELANDPTVVQRVSSGNFVDVPMKFKSILDGWAADRKEAAEATKTARERTKDGSFADFSNGSNPLALDIPGKTFDSWDSTEEGFARALENASRR